MYIRMDDKQATLKEERKSVQTDDMHSDRRNYNNDMWFYNQEWDFNRNKEWYQTYTPLSESIAKEWCESKKMGKKLNG